MNNFSRLSAAGLAARLVANERLALVIHERPDGDAVGSGAALALMLKELKKDVVLVSPDAIPKRLEFLTRGIKTSTEIPEGAALVALDVASPEKLGKFKGESFLMMIDHHASAIHFADCLTNPTASSTAEVLWSVFEVLNSTYGVKMTKEIAAALYAAISSDTGCFRFANASAQTMSIASALIALEIDTAEINRLLFDSKSKEILQAEGFVATRIKTELDGRVAYSSVSAAQRREIGAASEDFETAIDVVRSLMGAQVALFVRENDDGTLRANLRSTELNVAKIAERFGGGGHVRAAGCSPKCATVDEAVNKILNEIKKELV